MRHCNTAFCAGSLRHGRRASSHTEVSKLRYNKLPLGDKADFGMIFYFGSTVSSTDELSIQDYCYNSIYYNFISVPAASTTTRFNKDQRSPLKPVILTSYGLFCAYKVLERRLRSHFFSSTVSSTMAIPLKPVLLKWPEQPNL